MSEMIERVAKAIWAQRCKSVGADPAEGFTGMAWENNPSRHAETLAEARAAVAAIDTLYVEHAGPYQWTKTWWDAESGMIRSTVINAEDVKLNDH